jgi:hypothetical protein
MKKSFRVNCLGQLVCGDTDQGKDYVHSSEGYYELGLENELITHYKELNVVR